MQSGKGPPASPARRRWVAAGLALPWTLGGAGATAAPSGVRDETGDEVGEALSPWQPGSLDIHHLAYGRGNSTLVVLPDGTSLLIDAGAIHSPLVVSTAPRPSAARRPGEWISRYAARILRATGRTGLDYALMTHIHPDHIGDPQIGTPLSPSGTHRLTGIADVANTVPIGTLFDRGFPDYGYPTRWQAPFAENYFAFVQERVARGEVVKRIVAGRDDQIRPVGDPRNGAGWSVRCVAANGEVWTGRGAQTRSLFPALHTLRPHDYPDENMCSIGLRISYGPFGYFTAGDLTSNTFDGEMPWRDVLSAAAKSAGRVDVATADHHGMFDSVSGDAIRALRPRAWIVQAWHISHPGTQQLERMLSERLYPGPREIFMTNLMRENFLVNQRLMSRVASIEGHTVVRVAPGGASWHVVVTDNNDESDRVMLVAGPYGSNSDRT